MKDWQFILICVIIMFFSITGLAYIILGDFIMIAICCVISFIFFVILDNKK